MPSAMVPVTPGTLPELAEPAMPCSGNTATVALVLAWTMLRFLYLVIKSLKSRFIKHST